MNVVRLAYTRYVLGGTGGDWGPRRWRGREARYVSHWATITRMALRHVKMDSDGEHFISFFLLQIEQEITNVHIL